ncbi:tRNA pseudouridine(38-40) synthase TruA [Fulvivirga sp. 29W222]|uniref:tRNA pseudouridine synthase A n=1 Tax=Fulvivirga marina TaxID=2494733 RepID=A0A937KGZ1_9BACT|nr:tRNA pseudouridine(38-40) synthase TruA [Fulvivirga marina]MBL6449960.1 tRNA pseudouridine(38-40) synthase TruA [Fulvivirga marina]
MRKYFYLVELQFLGFRYHGWQKQPNVKTVQGMVEKTLTFILEHSEFRTLGSSRTDAMVSANNFAFELFMREPVDTQFLLEQLNINLPNDIRALSVEEVTENFNVIQDPKVKEYLYLFSYGEKNHPFCAPFMVYMKEQLDIELMKEGAKLFEGTHNFSSYCYKPSEDTILHREILYCEIRENDVFTANFFPKHSYALHVHGQGFMRHQVRLMMGTLFALGNGDITLEEIKKSLEDRHTEALSFMAPASGLMLNNLHYKHDH